MVFKSEIFTYIQQDWNDAISRAASLWAPRVREPAKFAIKNKHNIDLSDDFNLIDRDGNDERLEKPRDGGDCVLVNEHDVLQLWLPGRIIHIFSRRGVYDAAVVSRDFSDLRRIAVQGNIFRDHSSQSIFQALHEISSCRRARCRPPEWIPYDATDICKCCGSSFTWHSTFRGEAQQYRERYNCRSCGSLVCGPCSINRQPVMRLGLMTPSRICDTCFYSGNYASDTNPT